MPPEIKPPTTAEIEQALKNGLAKSPEIGDALKEFEVKEASTQVPQKTGIQVGDEGVPGMVKFIYKISGGSITEQKQAEYILLGVVVVFMSISLYLFFGGTRSSSSTIDPKMLQLHPELTK